MGAHHLRAGWGLQGALTLSAAQDPTRGTAAPAARCHRVISLLLLSPTVTFSPATLTRPAGGSATFFCNISIENNSSLEYNLNWYKETNHSVPQKIAQISRSIPQTKTEKYLLSNHNPVFKIEILNLHQNDSGSYYCGLIAFFQSNKVEESNRSHLVVTGQPKGTGCWCHPTVPPRRVGTGVDGEGMGTPGLVFGESPVGFCTSAME